MGGDDDLSFGWVSVGRGLGWEDDMNFEFDMFFVFFGVVFFWWGEGGLALKWSKKFLWSPFFFFQHLDQRILASFWPAGRGCPPFFWCICNPEICFVNVFFFFLFGFRGRDVRIPNKKTVYKLGGGFKHLFMFTPNLGEMIQFDVTSMIYRDEVTTDGGWTQARCIPGYATAKCQWSQWGWEVMYVW